MYNANASYEENYKNGPDARFLKPQIFPKIEFTNKPQFSFLGIPLHIPFGVPAGPLLNAAYMKVALEAGFCLPVYKTVRSGPWECHKWPNVLKIKSELKSLPEADLTQVEGIHFQEKDYQEKQLSISNSFGVPSFPVAVWQKDFNSLSSFSTKTGYHAILSFQGSKFTSKSEKDPHKIFLNDFQKTAELALNCIMQTGFSLLEMNLSCPNEINTPLYKDLPSAIQTLKLAKKVLEENNSKVKLIAKIGILNSEETKMFLSETAGIIDAVSAINTIPAKITDSKGNIVLGSGSLTGGVCGSLIFEQGVRMTHLLSETREKLGLHKSQFGIVGVGGVTNKNQFQSYLSAGADVVQAATGMMWNLRLAAEISHDLKVSFNEIQ